MGEGGARGFEGCGGLFITGRPQSVPELSERSVDSVIAAAFSCPKNPLASCEQQTAPVDQTVADKLHLDDLSDGCYDFLSGVRADYSGRICYRAAAAAAADKLFYMSRRSLVVRAATHFAQRTTNPQTVV